MAIKFKAESARIALTSFNFTDLFVRELGWSVPANANIKDLVVLDKTYHYKEIAQLAGAKIYQVWGQDTLAKDREQIMVHTPDLVKEKVVIFTDQEQDINWCNWVWLKPKDKKHVLREHMFTRGQTGDLFLNRLAKLHIDLSASAGEARIKQVSTSLTAALDIEKVTKKFYVEYKEQFEEFSKHIQGFEHEDDKRWYASVVLNRLMFIFFLQQKGFINKGDRQYLDTKLTETQTKEGQDKYFSIFLKSLFFEGFAKKEERPADVTARIGDIVYLNGGLFAQHKFEDEAKYPNISIPDKAFELLISNKEGKKGLFNRYSWSLNDLPGGKDNEINPSVLGYIFEKYINQKEFGAYYTRPEITEYLCEQTINQLILDKLNDSPDARLVPSLKGKSRSYKSMGELYQKMDDSTLRKLILGPNAVLKNLSLLDPSCGSGAFLVSALKVLVDTYGAIYGKAEFSHDKGIKTYFDDIKANHKSLNYYIKKQIIANNLYGVDIMEEATEIAKLRLFLALVSSATKVTELEPLPNIDFNIMCGNSLIGLIGVDATNYDEKTRSNNIGIQTSMFSAPFKTFTELVAEKERNIALYKQTEADATSLKVLKDSIEVARQVTKTLLDEMLLADMKNAGVNYTQSSWDATHKIYGKTTKYTLQLSHIQPLNPFHWAYEFSEVMRNGGFNAIITNPPWDVLQSDEKEWFGKNNSKILKKKIDIKKWNDLFPKLMSDPVVAKNWIDASTSITLQSSWLKKSKDYAGYITGKQNLYTLFTKRCFDLTSTLGYCGIVIPSGIYTDLGAKGLRKLLFERTKVTGLFCLENRKHIFENVDSRFKFVVLSFQKGGQTTSFPAAFMRHEVEELEQFPAEGSMTITVDFIKLQSPDSLSIMEIKNPEELIIANKLMLHPNLGSDAWGIKLSTEFNMTTDSSLFQVVQTEKTLPLYEGKMMHQFTHLFGSSRYFVEAKDGRKRVLGKTKDVGQLADYQKYRLAYRSIASSTNERTLICTILPPEVFMGHSLNYCASLTNEKLAYLCAVLNSYTYDFLLRTTVSANITMSFIKQSPVPFFTTKLIELSALACKLICTTESYAILWESIMKTPWSVEEAADTEDQRNAIRAELDARVAILYGLTASDFEYILSTFPLVPTKQRAMALQQFELLVEML